MGRWIARIFLLFALALVLLTGYGFYATREIPRPTRPIIIRGNLVAAAGSTGVATVRVFQAWAGAGALRHPLEALTQFQVPLGKFEHTIDYPLDDGEGLAVYAWLDVDGDKVHCTPTLRNEPAGLTEIPSRSDTIVNVTVELNQPCAGPEYFFPR